MYNCILQLANSTKIWLAGTGVPRQILPDWVLTTSNNFGRATTPFISIVLSSEVVDGYSSGDEVIVLIVVVVKKPLLT